MKRVITIILIIGIIGSLMGLFAAGQTEGTKDKIKIGLSLGTLQQERWVQERDMMLEYIANNHPDVELLVQAAEGDASRQVAQAENLLVQGADVLIVVPQDAEASGVIVEKAHETGVPVIAYDRMITNVDVDLYVSFDSVRVGEMMTQYAMERVPKGNYVILKGGPSDHNAHLVYEGNMNILEPFVKNGDVTIVADQWCEDWSPQEALRHTENALTASNNKVDVVLTGWDGLSQAAIQALAAQGLAGKVIVTGQDADLSACQAIVEGTQSMTIYKPLKELATAGVDAAIALAKGEKVQTNGAVNNGFKDVLASMPNIYAVDKTNIDEVIIKGGFRTLEEVYRNIPRSQWPSL